MAYIGFFGLLLFLDFMKPSRLCFSLVPDKNGRYCVNFYVDVSVRQILLIRSLIQNIVSILAKAQWNPRTLPAHG